MHTSVLGHPSINKHPLNRAMESPLRGIFAQIDVTLMFVLLPCKSE